MPTTIITDPVAILLAEHLEARDHIARFEAALATLDAADPASVARVIDATQDFLHFLETDLERHIRKEEQPLFRRIEQRLPDDERLIGELIAEHDQARLRWEQLRAAAATLRDHDHAEVRATCAHLRGALAGAPPDPARLRRIGQTLLRTLRVHFQKEEELVFPLAAELLTRGELAQAAREMAAIDAGADPCSVPWVEDMERRAQGVAPTEESGAWLSADLPSLAAELLASAEARREGRTARTLRKDGELRVVLVALRAGAHLREHTAPGPLTVQSLSGHAELRAAGCSYHLAPGSLLALSSRVPHELWAAEDSALLLTFTVGNA
jgi:hemerythrin-like domain-containing protein/quercetin dioxygenase-like cupin family protein